MAHWTRFEREQEKDVKKLICSLSGLHDERDKNYQLALQYAWSNFRFHRYLDVSSHSIQRTLDGIYDKFVIHSDLRKAESWKRLTQEFLNLPLSSSEGTKTDAHYAILSLLLCMSDSPSKNDFIEKPREKQAEEEEPFDWGKYLMEGEDVGLNEDDNTPEWSDISEEEEDQETLSREDSGIQVDKTPLDDADKKNTAPVVSWKVGEPDARTWLEQHVVPQYWTPRACRFSHSSHLHSNLAVIWDQHLYTTDPLYTPDDKTIVTETQVIRETLWLLSGVKKLFIFHLNDGKVTVRNDIIVTHMTHHCLRSVLEQIAAYGQVVFRLQRFMDDVTGHCAENSLPGTLPTTKKGAEAPFRTYQAFMWALYKYFMSFKEELSEIEKCIINKDETVTLAMVVSKLAPRLAQLKVLHKVFSTGIAEVPPDTRNVVRASHLLNTLYKAILEYDNVGEASEQTVSLLFFLWVETVRPYLEIVDEWIIHGHLFDPAKEFIIQRNKDVPVNHRDFWYATYTLYSVSEKTENEDKMSDNASASSGSDQAPASRQHTMVSFLRPVLKQIIMAGKSMQLLKNLKCKLSQQQDSSRDADRKSLYTLFLESVQSRLQHGKESGPDGITEQQVNKQSLIKMQSIVAKHLELNDVHDPLLAINFARLYLEQNDFHETFTCEDISVDRSSESVTCQSFELTLRSCLYPHIDQQYLDCCGNLMQTLTKDYKLVEYLQSMRNFFLLEAGDTMYDFYTSIFDKIREKEQWQNVVFLNVQLQEAVSQRYPEDSARLSIFFENVDLAKKKLPVHTLDGLVLSYKVPWPVDIVISSECQRIYNQIFLLLLLIKWAKYSLDVLQFNAVVSTVEKESPKTESGSEQHQLLSHLVTQTESKEQQIHRMFLLRVKLMHFVNSLHNYMMTRILHSTGLEFQHQVEEAKDLDQLIKIHYRYLSTIHDRCLLREKVSSVKEAIMKVLNVVLMFADRWHAGFGAWKAESILKMESDFTNCHKFLVKVLNKAVCRGSFPHLESLALSLMAGMEQS
ncbi:gamma-tubulin complex component 5 isoform 1-T1 [Anomaloglossus baeobatrachus]|uniref:gamma-tubulin complex component 5 isoform X1 n=1 Tax=Anomaloglossus baeobatrachus TaxID=238106 RepID=UPI003F4FEA87